MATQDKQTKQVQSFRPLRVRVPFFEGPTRNQKVPSPDAIRRMKPRRAPALLGQRGTQPKLASLRHGLLFGPAALRCSARFTARRSKANSNGNGNGNGNGKKQKQKQKQKQR
ncbi:hypothetical protein PQS31_15315 [Luteimonas sp BLCC-B24]|uniref:hypothetical protein n=1 Tax=Luteimonas sp. BLCC-B24 TaxID=3025317 RepID=UPI00234C05DC|nr:hypothetical protein [Luteimonas sp. BLCC-B24]MDC7808183.1 hypothetical protein [Luteimonas sp. BLCC-B24]